MPKFRAEESQAEEVRSILRRHKTLKHLRVRKYADTLLIESDDHGEVVRHTRLRRLSVSYWRLEMPAGSRWQVVPEKALLPDLVNDLIKLYPWVLTDFSSR
jgi:hypothetical protein